MAKAVELAVLVGSRPVDEALRRAAEAGRFGEDDLVSILDHGLRSQLHVVRADESFSAQPGTSAWEGFGRASSRRAHRSGRPASPEWLAGRSQLGV
jgi:hypothetical protein